MAGKDEITFVVDKESGQRWTSRDSYVCSLVRVIVEQTGCDDADSEKGLISINLI